MSDKYPVGRAERVLVNDLRWNSIPSAIEGHPVVAAFLRQDAEGWVVVFHEDTTSAEPYGYEDPDGFVIASLRANASRVSLLVLASDEAYVHAVAKASEFAYMNEG